MARSKEDAEALEQKAVADALARDNAAKAAMQAERDAHAATMRKETEAGKSELDVMLGEMSEDMRHRMRLESMVYYLTHSPQEPMSRQSDVDGICRRLAKYVLFGEAS